MARLNTITNEITKEPIVQLKQLATVVDTVQYWSNSILSKQVVNYVDPDTSDINYTSANAVTLGSFIKNFVINNPLSQINLRVCLRGNGTLFVLINDQLFRTIYFDHGTNSINLSVIENISLTNGSNKIEIKVSVATGTVVKRATQNIMQVLTTNS